MKSKQLGLAIFSSLLFCLTANAQLAKVNLTINNFVHQKSDFDFLNSVDTQGGFSESTHTFGQHYYLSKEKSLSKKLRLQYGIGLGYTRIGFRFFRSESFLSLGRVNQFPEKRAINTDVMAALPLALLYPAFENNTSALYLSITTKVIFAVRSGIRFTSGSSIDNRRTVMHQASFRINNENLPDFTIGAAVNYRKRISNSHWWWDVGLNFNYALTTLYTGEATLFGDSENLEIAIENKLNHIGISFGVLRSIK